MNIVSSFFIFFVIIFLVKCEDSCRVIPVHKGTVLTADLIPVTDSFGHQTGTQVLYVQADTTSSVDSGSSLYIRCRDPYRFQGNPTLVLGEIICRNGRWIPPPACLLPPCDIRSLNYPGLDKEEEITFFHGESFEPRCLHGYKVAEKADQRIHCENGKWTGNLPPCTKEPQCKLPEKPEFGSVELLGNSATVGSVVIFACDKGRKLIGSVISTCNNASVWTSPTPRCVEPQCELPEKPEFGSVELIGNSATVGSVVVFACDNGRKLIGSVLSVCNSASGWTSPSPRCVAQCNTESLLDFEGLAVESGLILSEGQWFQPKCNEGFQTANQDYSKIYCRGGEWEGSMPPCSPLEKEPCRSEPPEPENGKRKSEWWNIEHGASVEYECFPYHVMTETGSVVCSFGKWTGSLPVCKKNEDVITRVFASPPEDMKVGPGGVFFVIPGTRLELTCRATTGKHQFVNWTSPSDGGFYKPVTDRDRFKMQYIIPAASSRDSGKYTCFKESEAFRTLEVAVADNECEELELTEELAVSYVPSDRKFHSRAAFHCFSPYIRNGPSFVTCEASGLWSGPPPSCYLPTCSMGSLYDVIPEDIVPLIDGDMNENVPFGHELRLRCNEVGRIVRGDNTATCGEEGKWRVGANIHCVPPGCAGWQRKNGSTLLISPDKEFYAMGESIMFSCPQGKELTIDVYRIMCLRSSWTPNTIPDCQ